MTFKEYYGDPFRDDLRDVIAANPLKEKHVHDDVYALQPTAISNINPVIRSWDCDRASLFATALFYTVLVDQVFYTYYRLLYPQFQRLTRYPKFKGDCPGACNYHFHPQGILRATGAMVDDKLSPKFPQLLPDAEEVMKLEIMSFFKEYMPSIDGNEFWKKCLPEIPRMKR